jgi:hypothetical protein
VYKSKSSFLFFLVVLFSATAVILQSGGMRWRDVQLAFKLETHQDVASLRDDAEYIKYESKWAPVAVRNFMHDMRIEMRDMRSDLTAETKLPGR